MKNVLPWLLDIPGVTFVEREEVELDEPDTPRRTCRACRKRKELREFKGLTGRVCIDCTGTVGEKRNQAVSEAQTARHAANRAAKGEVI